LLAHDALVRREQSVSIQTLIDLVHIDRERVVDQNLWINTQAVGDNLPNPQEMRISPIKLILTGPLGSGHNQARNLFGSQLLRVNNDVEIVPVIDVYSVDFKVPLSVLLIALQSPIKNGLVSGVLIGLALKNSFRPGL
jgi:hypothetical protein